jgi:hypothetical protein
MTTRVRNNIDFRDSGGSEAKIGFDQTNNRLFLQVGGNDILYLTSTGLANVSVATGLTAGTTRTQAGALALTKSLNQVDTSTAPTTGTTLGDGVALPVASAGGAVTVINNTANPIQVYGNGSDTVNAVAGVTGIAIPAKSIVPFRASAAGAWFAETAFGFSGAAPTALVQTGITAFSGGGQGSAVALTGEYNFISTVAAAADSVKLPASAAGMIVFVYNGGANAAQVFGAGTDTIDGIATATGQPLPSKGLGVYVCNAAGTWQSNNVQVQPAGKFGSAANTTGFTATGAQIGGAEEVYLDLTGALGAGANIQLPTVAALVAAIPNAQVGTAYYLRIMNHSSGAFAWTVTTNTGWTLNGTMTIAQNFYREFMVTFTAIGAATLQSLGTTAQSAL